MNWQDARGRIESHAADNGPWQSDRKHLVQIFDYAEQAGLPAEPAIKASISNLRTIVPKARQAVHWGNTQQLQTLFEWASTLRLKDLRREVSLAKRDRITYHRRQVGGGEEQFEVVLTKEQFDRISRNYRDTFEFIEEGEVRDK